MVAQAIWFKPPLYGAFQEWPQFPPTPDWYQPAGLVTVTQDKRLYMKLDQKRLKRLKESSEQKE